MPGTGVDTSGSLVVREQTLGKTSGDVLKAIYTVQERGDRNAAVSPSAIAQRTGTSRPFVTKMLKTLAPLGLVEYVPYRGVRLTDVGRESAVELARHHRLLERFMTDALGFDPIVAHHEAERLEHVISEEFEERLAAFLNHPTTCPHGAPIPNPDGTLPIIEPLDLLASEDLG